MKLFGYGFSSAAKRYYAMYTIYALLGFKEIYITIKSIESKPREGGKPAK